jgi:putative flippase GtrA
MEQGQFRPWRSVPTFHRMREQVVSRQPRKWLLVAWVAGLLGSLVDWSSLYFLREHLRLPTPVAAGVGLCLANSINFLVNRRFAFRDCPAPLGVQVLRYAVSVGFLIALHASWMTLSVDGLQIPLFAAKLAGDFLVFGVSLPILLRTFVFSMTWKPSWRAPLAARGTV